MRFLRFALFALFWVAVGLGVGLLPVNGTTVWERLCGALASKNPSQVAAADKEAHSPLGKYTAEERAGIDKLIQRSTAGR